MTKVPITKFLLCCFSVILPAVAQGQPFESFIARLDTQEVDGKKIVVGWCENNTTSPVNVKYEALLKLRSKKEQVRTGSTLTLPASPTLLTKAVFTLNNVEFESVRLVIFDHQNNILTRDIIDSPHPLAHFKLNKTRTDPLPPPAVPLRRSRNEELEIDGLVLDETRSKLARDFYELFYRNWSAVSADAKGRTIIIKEMPGRIGIGTTIIVLIDDKSVMQLNLQPRTSLVEDLAGQLVDALEKYLNDPNNHTVIEGEDLTGSGIY